MPLEDCSSAASSFRHFKNKNLLTLWDETKNFEGQWSEGGYQGTIKTILIISSAVDLPGFGE